MDRLNLIFLKIFNFIYPFVYNHFVAYVQFFLALAFLAWRTFIYIRDHGSPKTWKERTWKLLLIAFELFLVLFMAWFIILHFQTFVDMKPGMSRLPADRATSIRRAVEPAPAPMEEYPASGEQLPPSER